MTTRRRMPGPATEWRVGARRARTFQQPLDPLAIEVSGVEAPQQCEDFFKSMKASWLGGHGGISCSTIR